MFPARAGMSPRRIPGIRVSLCVPRASGDEPRLRNLATSPAGCSPRERG